MADKCTGILKKQPEPKINDGEHKSSVTTDSTASTEVKTAINVDDKNAHNAKSMLSSVGAAEFKSSKVALVSRTTAYTPFNDITITRTANTTSIPILKTVRNKLQRSAILCFSIVVVYPKRGGKKEIRNVIRNWNGPCGSIEDVSIDTKTQTEKGLNEPKNSIFKEIRKHRIKRREKPGQC